MELIEDVNPNPHFNVCGSATLVDMWTPNLLHRIYRETALVTPQFCKAVCGLKKKRLDLVPKKMIAEIPSLSK